jgi:hypothetical protein
MKLFKLLLSFFVIVALFFGISLFFPHKFKAERSIEIDRPVEEVFAFMKDFKNWDNWSAWNKDQDSTLYTFYSISSDTFGSRKHFNGDLFGTGTFIINNYKPNEVVGYRLKMHGSEAQANGVFFFKPINNHTQLTWVDSTDVGYNPIFRYMVPSKKASTEEAFDEGLKRIKAYLEK